MSETPRPEDEECCAVRSWKVRGGWGCGSVAEHLQELGGVGFCGGRGFGYGDGDVVDVGGGDGDGGFGAGECVEGLVVGDLDAEEFLRAVVVDLRGGADVDGVAAGWDVVEVEGAVGAKLRGLRVALVAVEVELDGAGVDGHAGGDGDDAAADGVEAGERHLEVEVGVVLAVAKGDGGGVAE